MISHCRCYPFLGSVAAILWSIESRRQVHRGTDARIELKMKASAFVKIVKIASTFTSILFVKEDYKSKEVLRSLTRTVVMLKKLFISGKYKLVFKLIINFPWIGH